MVAVEGGEGGVGKDGVGADGVGADGVGKDILDGEEGGGERLVGQGEEEAEGVVSADVGAVFAGAEEGAEGPGLGESGGGGDGAAVGGEEGVRAEAEVEAAVSDEETEGEETEGGDGVESGALEVEGTADEGDGAAYDGDGAAYDEVGAADDEDGAADDEGGAVLDLGELDTQGRELVSVEGYHRVQRVDVDGGGALSDDEDNNELLSGVGFDAIVDTPRLLRVLEDDFGHATMTHVQLAAVPLIAGGADVVIQSYTGTGKTLAFLLPLVEALDGDRDAVQAVVVAPTRELAMQIFREADRLVAGSQFRAMALIGGANPVRQVEKIRAKVPHIVVGTPGRLAELNQNRVLRLRAVQTVVVDEIDQCMEDTFREHLECVIQSCPRDRQLVFASATGDNDHVRMYAARWMTKPQLLRVSGMCRMPSNIDHYCTIVPARLRIDILRRLMTTKDRPASAICFVDDPRRVDVVVERLFDMKLAAGALRGNAHKLERAEIIRLFRKGQVPLLVTTEVAARGLDVPEVTHVFNLDLPTDADHYIHRAGRCGRAGRKGTVVTIATAETAFVVERFAKDIGVEVQRMEPRGGEYSEPLDRSSFKEPRDRRTSVESKEEESGSVRKHRGPKERTAQKKNKGKRSVPYGRNGGFQSSSFDDDVESGFERPQRGEASTRASRHRGEGESDKFAGSRTRSRDSGSSSFGSRERGSRSDASFGGRDRGYHSDGPSSFAGHDRGYRSDDSTSSGERDFRSGRRGERGDQGFCSDRDGRRSSFGDRESSARRDSPRSFGVRRGDRDRREQLVDGRQDRFNRTASDDEGDRFSRRDSQPYDDRQDDRFARSQRDGDREGRFSRGGRGEREEGHRSYGRGGEGGRDRFDRDNDRQGAGRGRFSRDEDRRGGRRDGGALSGAELRMRNKEMKEERERGREWRQAHEGRGGASDESPERGRRGRDFAPPEGRSFSRDESPGRERRGRDFAPREGRSFSRDESPGRERRGRDFAPREGRTFSRDDSPVRGRGRDFAPREGRTFSRDESPMRERRGRDGRGPQRDSMPMREGRGQRGQEAEFGGRGRGAQDPYASEPDVEVDEGFDAHKTPKIGKFRKRSRKTVEERAKHGKWVGNRA